MIKCKQMFAGEFESGKIRRRKRKLSYYLLRCSENLCMQRFFFLCAVSPSSDPHNFDLHVFTDLA